MQTYQEALAFIHGRVKSHKDATMQRMQMLMEALGHPERKLNAIHVAGTNGKGSVVAFLRNMLEDSGLNVGTFTSPFLIRFNERISVNGVPISDAEVLRLVNLVAPIVKKIDDKLGGQGPTEFEVLTAMMFAYFAEGHADVVIVEVGIGGDNDSTNVLVPALSVITTIGYDHMQFLGNTLESIAGHKAGIIKPGVPVVIGRIEDGPRRVIAAAAQENDAPLSALDIDYHASSEAIGGWREQFQFSDSTHDIDHVQLNMMGDFQIANAATAIEAYLQFMGPDTPNLVRSIKTGVAKTQWAGRFDKLNDDPLVVIDGAHNLPAVQELVASIQNHFADRQIFMVIAILADKQYQPMLELLGRLPNVHLILTEFQGAHQRKAADLSAVSAQIEARNPVQFEADWRQAVVNSVNQMDAEDALFITGSLYFISEVRAYFKS